MTKLSIVVTSFSLDRMNDISALLSSISAQRERDIELVFVGERSKQLLENVVNEARRLGVVGKFVMNDGEPGLAQARNKGVDESSSPIIALIDDDVVLPEAWSSAVIAAFNDPGIVGVTGPATPLWDNDSMKWLPKELYWLISCNDWVRFRNPSDIRSLWGMNMAFKKEAFSVAGHFCSLSGYHSPIAEDLEFSIRVRNKTHKRLCFSPDMLVKHRVHDYRLTWRYIRDRSQHIGISRRVLSQSGVGMDREGGLMLRMMVNLPRRLGETPRKMFRISLLTSYIGFNIVLGYLAAAIRPSPQVRDIIFSLRQDLETP